MILLEKNENKIKLFFYFVLILVSVNTIWTFFEKSIFGDLKHFGDSQLYFCALKKYAENLNPYGDMNCFGKETIMHFQYTPLALIILYPINYIDLNTYKYLWFFLELISIIAIFFYSKKIFRFKTNSLILILFILFSFGGVGWSGFLSGNISIILCAIILYGINKLVEKKISLYLISIIIVSFFKPYYLIFLLSGFAIYKNYFFKYFFFSLTSLILINVIFFYFNQSLYLNYVEVVNIARSNIFYENFGSGIGLIGLLNGFIIDFNSNLLNISQIFWLSVVFLFSFVFIFYIKNIDDNTKLCFSLILSSFLNPYLMNYDLYIPIISILYLSESIFFYKNKINNIFFSLFLISFLITIHDKFACLFLLSLILFLFFIHSFKNIEKRIS